MSDTTQKTNAGSVIVTTVACSPQQVKFVTIANVLGIAHRGLVADELSVASVIASEPLAGGDVLLVGTGNTTFDAKCAAALGVPMLLVGLHDGAHIDMAREEAASHGATVIGHLIGGDVDAEHLKQAMADASAGVEPVMGQEAFEYWLMSRAREQARRIVLPEGDDDRVLEAADILLRNNVCELTILGDPDRIAERARELELDLSKARIENPDDSPHIEEFASQFYELRKAKGVTLDAARETMKDISYYATMMIHNGLADGMVSGAAHTTAHTIKPSFQIIKTKPGVSTVSSIFLMVLPGKLWAFGDCAVNPNPTAEQLAEIADVSAETASQFGIDPKVAMLSYSTGTSGHGPDVDLVKEAVELAKARRPELPIDGPLQFDAAVVPSVGEKKAPDSDVAGHATVMIFPDLGCGNITYKAVQRTSGALAVGPILQGLNKPVNDLSRGATVPDIVNTVAITAIQAQ